MKDRLLDVAKEALEQGHFKRAREVLERLMAEDEDDPDVLVLLGLTYLQLELPQRALDILVRAEEMVEENGVLSLFLGRAHKSLGQYEDAIDYLTRCVALDPDIVEAWIDLGEIYVKLQRYGDAARILEDAVIRFPEECELHTIRAMALYRLGDYTECAQEWKTLCELSPLSPAANANYAYSCLLLGRSEDATITLGRLRDIAPNYSSTRLLEAELAFQEHSIAIAERLFKEVLTMEPDNRVALVRLAVISRINGDEASCSDYLEQTCKIGCDKCEDWQKIIDSLVSLGEYDLLLRCLKSATQRDRGSAAAWIRLAEEYTRRGMSQEALMAWTRSIELRGYIKARCTSCNSEFKMPLHGNVTPPVSLAIECIYCGTSLLFPESLSRL